MENLKGSIELSQETLLAVIRVQTEIAQAGVDLGHVMALTAERAQLLTKADGAAIELLEGVDMVYRAACGLSKNQLGLRLKAATSLSGLCVAERKILSCEDSETDPRVNRDACRLVGLRSMIVVPLRHAEKTIGVIKVMSKVPSAFGAYEMQTLDMISNLVAAAMFHAARFETDELYRLATHDPLTGLPNRAMFFDRLRQSQAEADRHHERFAVLNLDMDGLKPINDSFGHRAGDAAICETAKRLKSHSRATDTVARLGGDEFAIILDRIGDPNIVHTQSNRLIEEVSAMALQFGEHHLPLSVSVGFAVYPDDAGSLEQLIDKADSSMYAAKRERTQQRTGTMSEKV
jgi:diguanylate cyclase (GGDEF)-like protein